MPDPQQDQSTGGEPGEITRLIHDVKTKTPGAVDSLIETVREDLRSRAEHRLRNSPPWRTLDPTDLVHEAYMRLFGGQEQSWNDRGHFFMAASRAMHDIIVERARKATAQKRGGLAVRAPYAEESVGTRDAVHAIELDDLLQRLEAISSRRADIVRLKFYAGLTELEIGKYLDISHATVKREWAVARVWLMSKISHSSEDPTHRQ